MGGHMDTRGPVDGSLDEIPGSDAALLRDELHDEDEARHAREQYRSEGVAAIPVPGDMACLLAAGEVVIGIHDGVTARQEPASPGSVAPASVEGTLYLTSQRLLVVHGGGLLEAALGDIEEAVVGRGRLLLILRGDIGLSLVLTRPQLLRVQVAEARMDLVSVPPQGSW